MFFFPCLAEEAQKSVRGLEDNAIHNKYIELVRDSIVWMGPPSLENFLELSQNFCHSIFISLGKKIRTGI